MSRGERWAAAALGLALGGCMRIYPDPELPDVVLGWPTGLECVDDGDRIVASLSAGDPAGDPATALEATAPCRDGSLRFDDVARLRYQLAARLEDATGAVLGDYAEELDLRDGLSKNAYAYFGRSLDSSFRVAWTFAMGASCESLSATTVVLEASLSGRPRAFFEAPCKLAVYVSALPLDGPYTLRARALAADTVVAASPDSAPFTIVLGATTDAGTLTLAPCGTACPPLGP